MKTKNSLLIILLLLLIVHSCDQLNEPPGNHSNFPAVSPDGQFIAYFCFPTNGDKTTRGVYIMSIDGNDKKLIYPQIYGSVQGWINWSPSGRQLLIQEGIITLQNKEFKEIQPNKILDSIEDIWDYTGNFTWMPDGNSLLYNIKDSIYICDTLFQHSRKLPLQGIGAYWMPNGEKLSYMRNGEIYITDTLSFQETQITNDGKWKSAPIPSPDGTMFSYVISYGDIWLINIDGSNARFLTKTYQEGYSWTPDSKSIIYSKTLDGWNTFLWKIDIDGKNDIQISK
jgi:Tol biopolymer transport system component